MEKLILSGLDSPLSNEDEARRDNISSDSNDIVEHIRHAHGPQGAHVMQGIINVMMTHLALLDMGCTVISIEIGHAWQRITIQNNAAARALPNVVKTRRCGPEGWESIHATHMNSVQIQFVVRGH